MAAAFDPVVGYDHTALSHEVVDSAVEERAVGMDLKPWLGKSIMLRTRGGRDFVGELQQRVDGVIQFKPDVAEDWDWFPRHLENDGSAIELTDSHGCLLASAVDEIRACLAMDVTSVARKTVSTKILWSLGGYDCSGAMLSEKGPWASEDRLLSMASEWDYARDAKKERVLKTVADPAANLRKVQEDIKRRELARKLAARGRRKNRIAASASKGNSEDRKTMPQAAASM